MASDPFDINRLIKLLAEFQSRWGDPDTQTIPSVPWWWQAGEAAGVNDFYVRPLDEEEVFLVGGTFVIERVDGLVSTRLWLGESDPLYQQALDNGALSEIDDAKYW